jgi:hypothetical protein
MLTYSSFQCMFCEGHERSHLPGGVLTFLDPMYAHLAQMVNLLQTPTSGPVTVFTNGASANSPEMVKAYKTIEAIGCKIESGKIIRLIPAAKPDIGVVVLMANDREVKVGYLAHKPATVLAGKELIMSLGVEIEEHPLLGQHIKLSNMMGSTTVAGVFAAGDASTLMKAVPNALSSGKLRNLDAKYSVTLQNQNQCQHN